MRGKIRELPPLEYLKECFEIDSSMPSGLRWRARPESHFKDKKTTDKYNKKYAGKEAGKLYQSNVYYFVSLNSRLYSCHRIIMSIFKNENVSPDLVVDHINRNPLDNRVENLRIATVTQNMINCKMMKNKKSGVHHVYKNHNGWTVMLSIEGKVKSFGTFKTIEAAGRRAREVSLEIYGQFSPFYNNLLEEEKKRQQIRDLIPSLNYRLHNWV